MKYAIIGFVMCVAMVLCFCAGIKLCTDAFVEECSNLGQFSVDSEVFECAPVISGALAEKP